MIKIINKPEIDSWEELAARPEQDNAGISESIKKIFAEVKTNGDSALIKFTEEFDKVKLKTVSIAVPPLDELEPFVSEPLKKAIALAKENIEKFHRSQLIQEPIIETSPGIKCWRKNVPIEKVGLYIPGGTAPLISTLLMLAIPAKIAGCKELVVCTPPEKDGSINKTIQFICALLGIKNIYAAGGSQAIAAMTFGTASILAVNKIFGPGNRFVTQGKIYAQQFGVAIDMPAGPSELMVIADATANASYVAADLLSQAEHGPDSQVLLLTNSVDLTLAVNEQLQIQSAYLSRKDSIQASLNYSKIILFDSINEAVQFSNIYAPEHLIIAIKNSEEILPEIINAGSVFIGNYSCESAGDYLSGPNHTLPTYGYAKNYSGVSTDSFIKKITYQEISRDGLIRVGKSIIELAMAESLDAHANAVRIRINN